jgi:uncharacterized protein YgbK (DUF1537 family)
MQNVCTDKRVAWMTGDGDAASDERSSSGVRRHAGLRLTFYGDDFTGSTDVMEALENAGISTVLFLTPPTPEALRSLPRIGAVGVAGVSRTWTPAEMDARLGAIIRGLRELGAPLFHYKICSTFDSSPRMGSIGRAADIVRREFPDRSIPLVVGVPQLGRYTAFGTLFATFGGEVYRLDRHPAMSVHPATPMHEADLRRVLAEQTALEVALISARDLDGDAGAVDRVLTAIEAAPDLVLVDVADHRQQRILGEALVRIADRAVRDGVPRAIIGSSGIEYALASVSAASVATQHSPGPATPTLAVVGSRAPASAAQVAVALAADFVDVGVVAVRLIADDDVRTAAAARAAEAIASGRHVVIHVGTETADVDGVELARALAATARAVVHRVAPRRLVVAGGDTSGYVAGALGIEAIRIVRSFTPGAPLCRVVAGDPAVVGMELCLKGGQVGAPDYLVRLAALDGAVLDFPVIETSRS